MSRAGWDEVRTELQPKLPPKVAYQETNRIGDAASRQTQAVCEIEINCFPHAARILTLPTIHLVLRYLLHNRCCHLVVSPRILLFYLFCHTSEFPGSKFQQVKRISQLVVVNQLAVDRMVISFDFYIWFGIETSHLRLPRINSELIYVLKSILRFHKNRANFSWLASQYRAYQNRWLEMSICRRLSNIWIFWSSLWSNPRTSLSSNDEQFWNAWW